MLSVPVPVLSFLFVSFRPSLIRSHSCSSGASLMLSLSGFSPFLPLSFVRFCSGSGYSAFCFFLSSFFPFPPLSCFFGAASPLSLPCFSPFFPTWFPVSSFPVLRTRLSVCFLSSLPVSLPQLFHRCFPFAFAFGLSPLFRFLSSASVLVLTTQPSALSFPFFPFSPGGGSYGASFLFRPACFHAFLPIPVLGLLHFLSPSLSRLTVATSAPLPSSFRLPRFPPSLPPGFPCFFSGFRYLASCSFPFVPPGFAPTAVPPVLPFSSASFRPLLLRAFPLAFRFLSSPSARF